MPSSQPLTLVGSVGSIAVCKGRGFLLSCMAMLRLVLFDIDGTLIRSGGAGERAFARAFELEFGIPNGTKDLPFAGRTDSSIAREFFVRQKIEPSEKNFHRFFDCYV